MSDEVFDVGEFAGTEEGEGFGPGVGVAEYAEDVDFAGGGCAEGEGELGCAHSYEDEFAAGSCCLYASVSECI